MMRSSLSPRRLHPKVGGRSVDADEISVASSISSSSSQNTNASANNNTTQKKKKSLRSKLRKSLGLSKHSKSDDMTRRSRKSQRRDSHRKSFSLTSTDSSITASSTSASSAARTEEDEMTVDSVKSSAVNPFAGPEPAHDRHEIKARKATTRTTETAEGAMTFSSNLISLLEQKTDQQQQGQRGKNGLTYFFTTGDKEQMVADLKVDFTETLVEQFGQGADPVEAHLCAATRLLHQFFVLDDTWIKPRMAMPGTTQDVLFQVVESFLYPRLSLLYLDLLDKDDSAKFSTKTNDSGEALIITPEEAAQIVSWIQDEFLAHVRAKAPLVEVMDEWQQDADQLVMHYLNRAVRHEMRECLMRALELQTEDDVREDGNFCMVTGLPEQVAYLYHQQIAVAQEELPPQYLTRVVAACNQELASLVCDMQLQIGSGWKDISPHFYCALINDANRLAEQCEEINEEYLTDFDDEAAEEGHRLIRDLAELALLATNYLCQRIMLDLCEPQNNILTSVGDAAWETDESCIAMEQTIATLKDFFADLEVWLKGYYFLKVLRSCFDLTIKIYLESFFANTLLHGVKSAAAAADELQNDYLRLIVFFNGSSFEKYHGAGRSFYSQAQINQELGLLQNMASIVMPDNHPDAVHQDIVAILQRFSRNEEGDGAAAVLHLAGLRKRHGGPESALWVKAVGAAKKDLANQGQGDGESVESPRAAIVSKKQRQMQAVSVPDLRNSRFVQNIRPFRQPLERVISGGTMQHAKSTLQLLEPSMPLYKKAQQFYHQRYLPYQQQIWNNESASPEQDTSTDDV